MTPTTPARWRIVYRNHRGDVAVRHIDVVTVRHGTSTHHPTPGWLVEAVDVARGVHRTFSMAPGHLLSLTPVDPTSDPTLKMAGATSPE